MFRFAKLAMASLAVGVGIFAVGCQSSGRSAQASGSGVVCDKCQLADVRTPYTVPSYEGPRQVGYFNTQGPTCPTCREHAANYAETGKLSNSSCDNCGGTMKVSAAGN
jgi:hypothetical protein